MPKPKLKSSESVPGGAIAKSMTALAASAAARVVVATASVDQTDTWNLIHDVEIPQSSVENYLNWETKSILRKESLRKPRSSNSYTVCGECVENATEKVDAITFIRTSKKPTSCECNSEGRLRLESTDISKSESAVNPDIAEELSGKLSTRSFSPLRFPFLHKRGSRQNVKNSKTPSSTPTKSNPNDDDKKEECNVKGCFLHTSQFSLPPVVAAAASAKDSSDKEKDKTKDNLGTSSNSSASSLASTTSETRKWGASLKFKAFRNARQQTFHSLDMYNPQVQAVETNQQSADFKETPGMSGTLDECIRKAICNEQISLERGDSNKSEIGTLSVENIRIHASLCGIKRTAAKYSAPPKMIPNEHLKSASTDGDYTVENISK